MAVMRVRRDGGGRKGRGEEEERKRKEVGTEKSLQHRIETL